MSFNGTLREAVSIVFSKGLAQRSVTAKQDALIKLAEFIEQSPHISTINEEGDDVFEDIYPFFTEAFDLRQNFQWEVTQRPLTFKERAQMKRIGFDTYVQQGFGLIVAGKRM